MADKNITKYNNRSLAKEMDELMDTFFGFGNTRTPKVDIIENGNAYTIKAAVAGYDPEKIDLYVEDHVLHIKGEVEKEEKKEGKLLHNEISRASFERAFSLPGDADEEKLSASCADGVLSITVEKAGKARPKRIEVKVGR